METMQQVLLRAHSNHPIFNMTMRDANVAARVRSQLDTIAREADDAVRLARHKPQDERSQHQVMNYCCRSATAIRAGAHRTSPRGLIMREANALFQKLMTAVIDSQLNFIVDVDNWWTEAITLWGHAQTAQLYRESTVITQFLTTFVKRLDPAMQERAIAYYNDLLHSYVKVDDKDRPQAVRTILREVRSARMSTCPEQPDMAILALFEEEEDGEHGDMSSQARVDSLRQRFEDISSVRFLTVPDDLYVVSRSGVGLAFWRTMIGRLLGGYSRLRVTEACSLFSTQTSEDEDAANINGTMVGRW